MKKHLGVPKKVLKLKNVVARDGIEPPTQAFSGLVLPELRYVALEKSRLLNFNANKNNSRCVVSVSRVCREICYNKFLNEVFYP